MNRKIIADTYAKGYDINEKIEALITIGGDGTILDVITESIACMLHCLATPLLFITQAQASTLSHEVPFFWQSMNYLFIIVSLAAITRSVQNSTNTYVKILLISAWSLLSFFIINESFEKSADDIEKFGAKNV